MSNKELAIDLYNVIKKLKKLYTKKDNIVDKYLKNGDDELTLNLRKVFDELYSKGDIMALEKNTEMETISFIEELLNTRTGIMDILNRFDNLLDADIYMSKMEDTFAISNKIIEDELKKSIKVENEGYNLEADELELYIAVYKDVKRLEEKLVSLLKI